MASKNKTNPYMGTYHVNAPDEASAPGYADFINDLFNRSMQDQVSRSTGSSSFNNVSNVNQLVSPEALAGFEGLKGILARNAYREALGNGSLPGEEAGLIKSTNRAYRNAAAGLEGSDSLGVDPAISNLAGSRASMLSNIPGQVASNEAARRATANEFASGVLGQFGTGQRTRGTTRTSGTTLNEGTTTTPGMPSSDLMTLQGWLNYGGMSPFDTVFQKPQKQNVWEQVGGSLLGMGGNLLGAGLLGGNNPKTGSGGGGGGR